MGNNEPGNALAALPSGDVLRATRRPAYWRNHADGWFSYRYPYTNSVPHKLKVLRYPPNGNVDEWVDHGPPPARP